MTLLCLGRNQLTEVPIALCNMRNMERLFLYDNHLQSLPSRMTRLTNLTLLDLEGNVALPQMFQKNLRKKKPEVQALLKDIGEHYRPIERGRKRCRRACILLIAFKRWRHTQPSMALIDPYVVRHIASLLHATRNHSVWRKNEETRTK